MKFSPIKIWIYLGHNNEQLNLTEKQQIEKLDFSNTMGHK